MTKDPSVGTVGTVAAERVADVLLGLAEREGQVGISALARDLALSKAVVYRILRSLVSRGLVEFDPATREYALGPSAAFLGARALRQLDLRDAARDDLLWLRDQTGETTTLSLLAVDRRTYVVQYESPQEIKMTVELGRLYPLYAGASGRSILAFLPATERDRVVDGTLEQLTDETILDVAMLRTRLDEIRESGFATSRGERQAGAGSVAAPVFRADGRVVGSISVCGPLARFDQEVIARYAPVVMAASAAITRRLGSHSD